MQGRIIKAVSGFYYLYCEGKVYECKARGSFKNRGKTLLVGDFAEFSVIDDTKGVVESVLDRKNELRRPAISNIDKLFIISSYVTPAPDTVMIDRLTAMALYHRIEPVIVFNKADMGDFSEYEAVYKKAGFKVYTVSALTGKGISELTLEFSTCVSAFSGNSGVGKSSILNSFFGEELRLQTGEVSDKLGRGRHTTRHTELYPHRLGGFVADTPGFSSLEAENGDYDFKLQLEFCFPEFEGFRDNCRFTGCTHTCEKGCGVLMAIENGEISKSRHLSYLALFDELKDLKAWNSQKK